MAIAMASTSRAPPACRAAPSTRRCGGSKTPGSCDRPRRDAKDRQTRATAAAEVLRNHRQRRAGARGGRRAVSDAGTRRQPPSFAPPPRHDPRAPRGPVAFLAGARPGSIRARARRLDWTREWEAELESRERRAARLGPRPRVVARIREGTSTVWDALWLQSARWEDEVIQDIRFGLRLLRRSPWLSGTAIASLAIGIGATTAVSP